MTPQAEFRWTFPSEPRSELETWIAQAKAISVERNPIFARAAGDRHYFRVANYFGSGLELGISARRSSASVFVYANHGNFGGVGVEERFEPLATTRQLFENRFGSRLELAGPSPQRKSGAIRVRVEGGYQDGAPTAGLFDTLDEVERLTWQALAEGAGKARSERALETRGTVDASGADPYLVLPHQEVTRLFTAPAREGSVRITLFPGDLVSQARRLYGRTDLQLAGHLEKLQRDGWDVTPNFHFGFASTGYAWSKTGMGIHEYVEYWRSNLDWIGEIESGDWGPMWARLQSDGIVTPADRAEFDRHFTSTRRSVAQLRPGIRCEATVADEGGTANELGAAIAHRAGELLNLLSK